MKKLREKTFFTIFSIISVFVLTATFFVNASFYEREYSNILLNLKRMNKEVEPIPLENKIILDYNFYTILLDRNNNIIDKISHNNTTISNELLEKALNIIKTNKSSIKINCLYFSTISYSYVPKKYLVIVDTTNVRKTLIINLLKSSILLVIIEIITYHISKKITTWITKPVEESFNNQKEFIANASHELKTPLAVIIASTDCIKSSKQNEKYLSNIKVESENMNNLITRLLDLSKTEQNSNIELRKLNNLSKIVTKKVLVFESLAFENNVFLEEVIEEDVMFKCNCFDMDELLGILIDNAIKHSYKNSKIQIKLYKNSKNIIIEVTNNGEEIPSSEYDKIFERFYRSDLSRNRKTNRYGLGLAIAKNIVNNYNGTIKVTSENNVTTFKVVFKITNL